MQFWFSIDVAFKLCSFFRVDFSCLVFFSSHLPNSLFLHWSKHQTKFLVHDFLYFILGITSCDSNRDILINYQSLWFGTFHWWRTLNWIRLVNQKRRSSQLHCRNLLHWSAKSFIIRHTHTHENSHSQSMEKSEIIYGYRWKRNRSSTNQIKRRLWIFFR